MAIHFKGRVWTRLVPCSIPSVRPGLAASPRGLGLPTVQATAAAPRAEPEGIDRIGRGGAVKGRVAGYAHMRWAGPRPPSSWETGTTVHGCGRSADVEQLIPREEGGFGLWLVLHSPARQLLCVHSLSPRILNVLDSAFGLSEFLTF